MALPYSTIPNAANDWDDDITQMRANFAYLADVEEEADVTDTANVTSAGAVMKTTYNAHTILAATSDDTPVALALAASTIVGRTDSSAIKDLTAAEVRTIINVENNSDKTDTDNVNSSGAVMESDYNAQTILAATSDNTPAAVTIAEQRLVGRITGGNIIGLTAAQIRTLLSLVVGTNVQAYDANTSKTDVAETRSASINMADNTLQRPYLKDVAETRIEKGNTGSACAFDFSTANIFTATVDQNTAFTFTNAPASGRSAYAVLYLTNPGAFTIDWTGGSTQTFKWENSSAPSFTTSGIDVVVITSLTGSTGTWYGFMAGQDMGAP